MPGFIRCAKQRVRERRHVVGKQCTQPMKNAVLHMRNHHSHVVLRSQWLIQLELSFVFLEQNFSPFFARNGNSGSSRHKYLAGYLSDGFCSFPSSSLPERVLVEPSLLLSLRIV